jgi:hypothetical protein
MSDFDYDRHVVDEYVSVISGILAQLNSDALHSMVLTALVAYMADKAAAEEQADPTIDRPDYLEFFVRQVQQVRGKDYE